VSLHPLHLYFQRRLPPSPLRPVPLLSFTPELCLRLSLPPVDEACSAYLMKVTKQVRHPSPFLFLWLNRILPIFFLSSCSLSYHRTPRTGAGPSPDFSLTFPIDDDLLPFDDSFFIVRSLGFHLTAPRSPCPLRSVLLKIERLSFFFLSKDDRGNSPLCRPGNVVLL